mmetsp:Transcript_1495/g.3154  ORF Transcript_1495/g.3154 Transcript_1495/m.3154 type:complete len:221 (+) Transcript_1495:283-945(+)
MWGLRSMTMAVMSSTMGLRLSHRRRAVVDSTVAASPTSHGAAGPPPLAVSALCKCWATSCTACADSTTSQIPSVAKIKKQSLPSTRCSVISGSADTPIVCTMASPRERLMARPMVSPLELYHTRAGPRGMVTGPFALCPTTSCRDPTCPPAASTRLRSSGRSGLWSDVRLTAPIWPWCFRPNTARESPQFPTSSTPFRSTTMTAVAPAQRTSNGALSNSA